MTEEQSTQLFRQEMAQLREDIAAMHASIAQDRRMRREWAELRAEFDAYKASQAREIATRRIVVSGDGTSTEIRPAEILLEVPRGHGGIPDEPGVGSYIHLRALDFAAEIAAGCDLGRDESRYGVTMITTCENTVPYAGTIARADDDEMRNTVDGIEIVS